MVQSQVKLSADERLQQEPQFLLDWLHDIEQGKAQTPADFNWLGLAQGAAFCANQQWELGNRPLSLQWAEVAIALYNHLNQITPPAETDPNTESAMQLRATLIRTWGVDPKQDILDPDVIAHWFLSHLDGSLSDIKQAAQPWQDPAIFQNRDYVIQHLDSLKRLRRLKTRLNILQHLLGVEGWEPSPELRQWLELSAILP